MNRDEQHSDRPQAQDREYVGGSHIHSPSFVDKAGAARASSIELRIEELVLHGFEPRDRYRIGEAVERELTRLFAERGVPPSLTQGGEVALLDSGIFQVAPNSRIEAIGIQVAQAVYRGLNK